MAASEPSTAYTPPVLSSELDGALRVWLTEVVNKNLPVNPASVEPLARRKLFETFAARYNGEALPVHRAENTIVPTPAGDLALRVYVPRPSDKPLPVVLFAHGGGWHAGSLDTHDPPCRRIANAGSVIVASLNYRMAPEARAPAPMDDVVRAYAWLRSNIHAFGGDPDRIGLMGDSAGATIMSCVALRFADGRVPAGLPPPTACFLIYPCFDLTASGPSFATFAEGYYLRSESVRHYVKLWLGDSGLKPEDPELSALLAPMERLRRLVPMYSFSAGHDPLVSDADAFTAKLKEAGATAEHICYKPLIHAFMHLGVISPACDAATADIGDRAGSVMRGER